MKSLSQFVTYNHWEKLSDNFLAVSETNFISLVATSVIYHSKECFNLLIKHDNRIKWINKQYNHRKLRKVFENYYYGPNKLNEYYVREILKIIEFIELANLKYLMINKEIFYLVFDKLEKTQSSIIAIIHKISQADDVDAFLIVHNFMLKNSQTYPFYSDQFIIDTILYEVIISGAIGIIKELDKFHYNLSKTKYKSQDVSTLVLALGLTNEKDQVFRYLYNKYPEITQNLLWCNWIEPNYSDNYAYYLKFNIGWTPTIDFTKIIGNYEPNDNGQILEQLTQDNLILKIQTVINELEEDDAYYEIHYYFDIMFDTIDYLIRLSKISHPELSQYLKTILSTNELNLMKMVCSVFIPTINTIKNDNSSSKFSRARMSSIRKRRTKRAIEKLETIFNIVRFVKENKLPEYNPIQLEYFSKNINKAKPYVKVIIMHLIKLGFPVSEQFRKEIIENVFNKTELKTFETTINNLNSDNFFRDFKAIKKLKKPTKSKKKKSKKQANTNANAITPAMDDADSDNEQLIENQSDYEDDIEI